MHFRPWRTYPAVSIPLSALVPRRVIFRSADQNLAFRGVRPLRIPCALRKRNIKIEPRDFSLFLLFFLVAGKKCLNCEVEPLRILNMRP